MADAEDPLVELVEPAAERDVEAVEGDAAPAVPPDIQPGSTDRGG